MTAAHHDRSIRVFVSSTFRDMQEDRDYLIKKVFPQLRRLCEERNVTWTEVDLRWGITEEEAAEGKVMPLCLAEIQRSRPYFIGLLGERYGWVPRLEDIPEDLLEQEQWLREHLSLSVTELEIIHGVLRADLMHHQAYFYFRDPGYLNHLPQGRNRDDFTCEDPELHEKLDRLKSRIKVAAQKQVCELRENYRDPKQLGEWILEDFQRLIDQQFPVSEIPDPLDRETAEHEAFARSRQQVYIGRQEYFDRLDAHISGNDPPLVVMGESGAGKSALLANWYLSRFVETTEPITPESELSLIHFIGSTNASSSESLMMQRIMQELKRTFNLQHEIPSQSDKIREAFPEWLNKVAGLGRIVLILDALNQLDNQDNAHDLHWLPKVLPPNIRLILCTLPGQAQQEIQERGWPELHVQPLEETERRELTTQYLQRFSRKLDAHRLDRIISSPQTINPLFLQGLLEELRQFGEHERLDEMIAHYLSATGPEGLYRLIVKRWADDFGDALVRESLCLIWAARRGLSEAELLNMLGKNGEPLPRAEWTPFYLAAESSLAKRGGLFNFFHDYLRQAVETEYLEDEETRKSFHSSLANYFDSLEQLTDRKLVELPWQWQQAEEWERLKNLLTEMQVFAKLRSTDTFQQDLQRYWLSLQPYYDCGQSYQDVQTFWETESDSPVAFAEAIQVLGAFHNHRAEYNAAEQCIRRSLSIFEHNLGNSHINVAATLNELAIILSKTDRFKEALTFCQQALEIKRNYYGKESSEVALGLNNLAQLYKKTIQLQEAESLLKQAIEICEKTHGHPHLKAAYYTNLAELMLCYKKYDEAEPLFYRALEINEHTFGNSHPEVARSLNNLGALLTETEQYEEAERIIRRALALWEHILGEDHPLISTALNSLGILLQKTDRMEESELLFRRALNIDILCYGNDHPDVATDLNNLALTLYDSNRLEEAESLFRQALKIDKQSYGSLHTSVAIRMYNLGLLLKKTNRIKEAEDLFHQVIKIWENSYGYEYPPIENCLIDLADMFKKNNRFQEAESTYLRALELSEQIHGNIHPRIANILNELGMILHRMNRLEKAEIFYRRSAKIFEESCNDEHSDYFAVMNNLAQLLQTTNQLEEAELLQRKVLEYDEKCHGSDAPHVAHSLNYLAGILEEANRFHEAEPLMRRALSILHKSYGDKHPRVLIFQNNMAKLLLRLNRTEEGESLSRQIIAIASSTLGDQDPSLVYMRSVLSRILRAQGKLEEAVTEISDAVKIIYRNHPVTNADNSLESVILENYRETLQEAGISAEQIEHRLSELQKSVD